MIEVSIVILNYKTPDLTCDCIESILKHSRTKRMEIILVDNGSNDGSLQRFKCYEKNIKVIALPQNIGFSAGNNVGIQSSSGKNILLLNSDTLLHNDVISDLVSFLEAHPQVAAVSPKLLNKNGSDQKSFYSFPRLWKSVAHLIGISKFVKWNARHKLVDDQPIFVDYCIFAAVMVRKLTFEEIGLLDENFFFYHEDCEFGLRIRQNNMKFAMLPNSALTHLGSGSANLVQPMAYYNFFKGIDLVYEKYYSSKTLIIYRTMAIIILKFKLLIMKIKNPAFNTPSDYGSRFEKDFQESELGKQYLKKLHDYFYFRLFSGNSKI